jgi:hypothetical protein
MDIKYYSEFFDVLVCDCSEAAEIWGDKCTPYTRRAYVKAVFSFIDGNTFRLNKLWLDCHEMGHFALNQKQVNQLRGYKFGEDGNKIVLKSSILDSIKLSFSVPSKAKDIDNSLNTIGNEWNTFQEAVSIRHRLTHPKSVDDLEIPLHEMKVIESAADFYRLSTMSLMQRLI